MAQVITLARFQQKREIKQNKRMFTDDDLKFICDSWDKLPPQEIADQLCCSRVTIYKYASKLGLDTNCFSEKGKVKEGYFDVHEVRERTWLI